MILSRVMPTEWFWVVWSKLPSAAIKEQFPYLMLAVAARGLNALAMFLVVRRFAPAAFGEFTYLQATSSVVAGFCSFGLETSINSRLARGRINGQPAAATLAAGGLVVLIGSIVAALALWIFQSRYRDGAGGQEFWLLAGLSIFAIGTSYVNAICFSASRNILVAIAAVLSASGFLALSYALDPDSAGRALFGIFCAAQGFALACQGALLLAAARKRPASSPGAAGSAVDLNPLLKDVVDLLRFGAKQSLVGGLFLASNWAIQHALVAGGGGPAANAIYSVGNQLFNIVCFFPLIVSPILVTRMSERSGDHLRRRRLCLKASVWFFAAALVLCAVIGLALKFLLTFLPDYYAAAFFVGLLAIAAAAVQLARVPFSIYFVAEMQVSPDAVSMISYALTILAGLFVIPTVDPLAAMGLRVVAQLVMLGVTVAIFAADGAKGSGNTP